MPAHQLRRQLTQSETRLPFGKLAREQNRPPKHIKRIVICLTIRKGLLEFTQQDWHPTDLASP